MDILTPYEDIISKDINSLQMKDYLCLLIYAFSRLAKIDDTFDKIYKEFILETEKQCKTWPRLTTIYNEYSNRIDLVTTSHPFIDSQNILTIVLRFLYIESIKAKRNPKKSILLYQPKTVFYSFRKIELTELIKVIEDCMDHYLKLYANSSKFENRMAKSLIKLF
jgi:hypothetical protein